MLRLVTAITAIATGLLIAGTLPASAQALCSDRSNFLKHLGANHSEAPAAMGLTSGGKVVEVLTSESGTWTIIVTNPDGTSCIVAAGEAWEDIEPIALKEPAA